MTKHSGGGIPKKVTAEYRARERMLKLDAPLEGVADHARVLVEIQEEVVDATPWIRLKGVLSSEAGESLARAVDELFGKSDARRS